LAAVGVFMARSDVFLALEKTQLFYISAIGIFLAFTGIAIYASGMPRTLQKARVCPSCYAKNAIMAQTCKQCRKKLPEKEE